MNKKKHKRGHFIKKKAKNESGTVRGDARVPQPSERLRSKPHQLGKSGKLEPVVRAWATT